jgi:UDP-2,4-diacetamido-2,4,6-trideoxy-beta-L-altropyranose hydrolase
MRRADATIRVDAGPQIGLGHMRRCMTLAAALRAADYQVRFITRQWESDDAPPGAAYPVTVLTPDAANDESSDACATLDAIGRAPAQASWVVIDHYGRGECWEKAMGAAGYRVLAIDDFRHRRHRAELLVSDSQTPFDPALNACPDAIVLTGRCYALIGPEYAYSRERAKPVCMPPNVLISYGSADATGETLKAMTAISSLRGQRARGSPIGEVHVAIGRFNARATEIDRVASQMTGVVIHRAPSGLAPLMRTADLVLTAGGNSLVEALALRKPCLVTVTAENQSLMVAQLAADAVIRSLGFHDRVSAADMAHALDELSQSLVAFAAQVAAKPVFDHLGAQRVVEAMSRLDSRTRQ